MSTSDQEEMFIPGPEQDIDFSVFDGFDPLSCARDHHCVPDVAKSTNASIHAQLRWIQERAMQIFPDVQQILMRLVHEKTQESRTPNTDALQKDWPK